MKGGFRGTPGTPPRSATDFTTAVTKGLPTEAILGLVSNQCIRKCSLQVPNHQVPSVPNPPPSILTVSLTNRVHIPRFNELGVVAYVHKPGSPMLPHGYTIACWKVSTITNQTDPSEAISISTRLHYTDSELDRSLKYAVILQTTNMIWAVPVHHISTGDVAPFCQ